VTGQVQFLSRPSAKDPKDQEYVAAVILYPKSGAELKEMVKVVPAPPDQFLN
jgi:hypothetical protein